jgi:hydrophobe/amphiphile efflux-1 (HAE1) family protein
MSFNISEWSIKKPLPTIVLFLVLAIFGCFSFTTLGIDNNPNVDIPTVLIIVNQAGAGPVELESQVTRKIEDSVAALGNIDNIISTVEDGKSTTTVNFLLGTNIDRATNDVRNAIAQVRQNLPQDINEPVVKRRESAGRPILTYAVTSSQKTVEELSNLVDQEISRALLTVKGVAQIKRIGGVNREIRVNLDPIQLQSLGITATQVNDQIRAFNTNLPGGQATIGGSEQNIRTLGSANNVDILKTYEIVLPKGGSVILSSLGMIDDSYGDVRQVAKLNNKSVVAFQVLRSSGSVTVTVEKGVQESINKLQQSFNKDVKIELIFTLATYIKETYTSTIHDLIIASVLAVLTIMLFLRNWRATLIIAVALPLSIIPTFAIQQILGYTLNSMTLLALALAVGNLVDDAVVEIENMERHMDMGKPPFQAAIDSAEEVGLAVVACSATIVAVFLPVAFMGGIPGQFFQPFGVTVSVATIFSTFVARMITPMMGAYLLKDKTHNQQQIRKQLKISSPRRRFQPYKSLLTWALRHRLTTIVLATTFFVGSLLLVPLIPKGFIDSSDIGTSTLSVELPPGSTLQDTDQIVNQTTNLIRGSTAGEAVESILATENVNNAILTIKLIPREKRFTQAEFEQKVRPEFRKISGARISFQAQGVTGSKKDLTILLKSENSDTLQQAANALEKQMRTVPGLVEVNSSASLVRPEILIIPDPQRAGDLGVTVQSIARTASLATIGDNDSALAKFNLIDRQIPIRVQIDPKAKAEINSLKNLQVPSQNGSLVPLIEVADIRFGSGPAQIDRNDRSRQVSIEGNLAKGVSLGDAVQAVNKLPALLNLPAGVVQQEAGDAKIMGEIFSRFGIALALALMCIYLILALLYNNLLHPITIMMALPFCLGGALLGLLITQKALGLYALIGIVLLMGIVTKNSILLVDYTMINLKEGKSQRKALLEAGISRLRPILMTSIATVAGIFPLALGLGSGAEVRQPMGIAIMGGFITSTMLTLVVVPVFFSYVDDLQNLILNTARYKTRRK